MVRPDPTADEIDQRRQRNVAAAGVRCVGSKAKDLAGTARKFVPAIGAIEESEPRRSGQRGNLLARKRRQRGATDEEGERARHFSAVIPAERRGAREPGSMYPCRARFTDAGVLGSRVSPLLRLARDDSRGA